MNLSREKVRQILDGSVRALLEEIGFEVQVLEALDLTALDRGAVRAGAMGVLAGLVEGSENFTAEELESLAGGVEELARKLRLDAVDKRERTE